MAIRLLNEGLSAREKIYFVPPPSHTFLRTAKELEALTKEELMNVLKSKQNYNWNFEGIRNSYWTDKGRLLYFGDSEEIEKILYPSEIFLRKPAIKIDMLAKASTETITGYLYNDLLKSSRPNIKLVINFLGTQLKRFSYDSPKALMSFGHKLYKEIEGQSDLYRYTLSSLMDIEINTVNDLEGYIIPSIMDFGTGDNGQLSLLFAILMSARLSRIPSNDDTYKATLKKKLIREFNWCDKRVFNETCIQRLELIINHQVISKFCAAVSQFFTICPKHELVSIETLVIDCRNKGYSGFAAYNTLAELLGSESETMPWMMTKDLSDDFDRIMKPNEEVDLYYSYGKFGMMYQMMDRSPYSIKSNKHITFLVYAVQCTLKNNTYYNRIIDININTIDLIRLVKMIFYALQGKSTFYEDETILRKEKVLPPNTKDALSWWKWYELKGQFPETYKASLVKIWSEIPSNVRRGTIGYFLRDLAGVAGESRQNN